MLYKCWAKTLHRGSCVLSILFLASCSGGSDSPPPPDQPQAPVVSDDITAPNASIIFPTSNSMTAANSLTIRGTAFDESTISSVSVNGVNATTTNEFLNWTANVPLDYDTNTLTVQTVDEHNNAGEAANLIISNNNYLLKPVSAVLDSVQNRLLIADQTGSVIYQLNLTSNKISKYIDLSNIISTYNILTDMTFDPNQRQLYVGTFGSGFVRIDLDTNTATLFSDVNLTFFGIAFNTIFNTLYSYETTAGILLQTDLITGSNRILSAGDNFGFKVGSGPDISTTWGIDIDYSNLTESGQLLTYVKYNESIIAVNLNNGDRTILSSSNQGTGPAFNNAFDVIVNSVSKKAYVINNTDEVLEVDMITGNRSIKSAALNSNEYDNQFNLVYNSVLNSSGDALYVLDSASSSIINVSLNDGSRINTYKSPVGSGPHLKSYGKMQLVQSKLIVLDPVGDAIYEIDTMDGARKIISDNTNTGPAINAPLSICINQNTGLAYIADYGIIDNIYEVNLSTGQRRLVTSSENSNDIDFNSLTSIACDGANTLYLANSYTSITSDKLVSIQIDTGTVNLISAANTSDIDLKDIGAMVLNTAKSHALISSQFSDAVIQINLSSGVREIISDNEIGTGPKYSRLSTIYKDTLDQYYLVDTENDTIMSFDLSTGDRTVILSNNIGNGQEQRQNSDIAIDSTKNIMYATDTILGAVLSIDMTTGDRVIISK